MQIKEEIPLLILLLVDIIYSFVPFIIVGY